MNATELSLTPEKPSFIEGYGPEIWQRLEMHSENGAQISDMKPGMAGPPAWWRIDLVWPAERKEV